MCQALGFRKNKTDVASVPQGKKGKPALTGRKVFQKKVAGGCGPANLGTLIQGGDRAVGA